MQSSADKYRENKQKAIKVATKDKCTLRKTAKKSMTKVKEVQNKQLKKLDLLTLFLLQHTTESIKSSATRQLEPTSKKDEHETAPAAELTTTGEPDDANTPNDPTSKKCEQSTN